MSNNHTQSLRDGALRIVKELKDKGHAAYFVGGAVRDALLGKSLKDIDIATSAKPDEIVALFPRTHLIGAAFGIVNVVVDDHPYEVATFREERDYLDGRHPETVKYTDNPELDAQRRDFTINGLFLDPLEDRVLDFVGGVEDLRRGQLRAIGDADARMREDYLRMLRAVRFAARFDFELCPDVVEAIKRHAGKAATLSAERVRDELTKTFTGPHADKALRTLSDTGLLGVVLPEVEALNGVPQPKQHHPEGDVFVHTALMLSRMAVPDEELAWSIVLHDVGKPPTLTIDKNGVEHFYSHDEKGAAMAEEIMRRLRFPNNTTDRVVHAVARHMRYAFVAEMRRGKWMALINEPTFTLEMELHRIDCAASHGGHENFLFLLDRVTELRGEIKPPPPLATGKDLIAMGYKPGPRFSEILKAVAERQLEGDLTTPEDALRWIRENHPV